MPHWLGRAAVSGEKVISLFVLGNYNTKAQCCASAIVGDVVEIGGEMPVF